MPHTWSGRVSFKLIVLHARAEGSGRQRNGQSDARAEHALRSVATAASKRALNTKDASRRTGKAVLPSRRRVATLLENPISRTVDT